MSFSNISSQSLAHHVFSFSRIYVTSRTKRGFNSDEIQFFLIFPLLRLIFLVLYSRPLPSPRRGAFSMFFLIFLHLRVDLWTVWINHLSALKLFLLCMIVIFFPSTICYKNFLFTTPQFVPSQQINCLGDSYSSMVESLPKTPEFYHPHWEESWSHLWVHFWTSFPAHWFVCHLCLHCMPSLTSVLFSFVLFSI